MLMDTETILNPFVVGRYVSDRYFCDRQAETEFLVKQIMNGRHTALISPRRMGKTGLIHHCFRQPTLNEHYHTFFIDIYATSSLTEFVFLLGKAIYDELKPKKTDIQTPQTTLDEIFEYLEAADKPCLVAIDEFQQIGTYEEKNVEALLRTKIQQCRKTSFIFSGSKRHVMSNMFNSSSKPFYQSAISMGLDPIPLATYREFALRLFEERGKHLEAALVDQVYQQLEGCTWFVQMMMNELFALTTPGGSCDESKLDTAWENVIRSQEGSYKDMLSHLAPKQKLVLQAIAKERQASGITSSAFIKKYKLPSASSVQSAVKPLLKHDIVTQEGDTYRVYDYFFAEWLRKFY